MSATSSELFSTQTGSTGPRVVFLHGLFGQGKNWTTVAKALSDEARVTLVDLPNHGRSAWTDHFSYPEMADQVAGLLESQGDGEPYAVVGHSMGGKIAMALALRHPELVERLCVVDVSPVATSEISNFETFVRGMRSIDLASLTDRESASAQLEPYVPEPGVRSFLLQNLRRDHGRDPGWRWQMNLQLLGDHLPEMGSWPELDAAAVPRTGALVGRRRLALHQARVRGGDAGPVSARPTGHGSRGPVTGCTAISRRSSSRRSVSSCICSSGRYGIVRT